MEAILLSRQSSICYNLLTSVLILQSISDKALPLATATDATVVSLSTEVVVSLNTKVLLSHTYSSLKESCGIAACVNFPLEMYNRLLQ